MNYAVMNEFVLDLRSEPMVISVPAVERSHYFSVRLVDGNVYNYGYIGTRATGTDAGDYLVAGPDWKGDTPPGIERVFHSTTPFGLTIFRTQLFDPEDMQNVEKVQAGYAAQPLSAFLNQPAPPEAPKIDLPPASSAGIKANFFQYLESALSFVPMTPDNLCTSRKTHPVRKSTLRHDHRRRCCCARSAG